MPERSSVAVALKAGADALTPPTTLCSASIRHDRDAALVRNAQDRECSSAARG